MPKPLFDVLIIGAGAAGCYCAISAAARGLRVAVLERNADIGAKIRVSGGGRCNISNLDIQPQHYLSHNPSFCRSALARHSQWDFLQWFSAQGLHYEEKTLGQLFCVEKSRGLIQALRDNLQALAVDVFYQHSVLAIEPCATGYRLHSTQGDFFAPQVVIASGGASFAKLGATDYALRFAKQLNIANFPFRPALVPLTLEKPLSALSGISCWVSAQTGHSPLFHEQMLFTHRGLSGPAILQISSYWQKGAAVEINFLPQLPDDFLLTAKKEQGHKTLVQFLKAHLPQALAQHLAAPYPNRFISELPNQHLRSIGENWQHHRFIPNGTEGMHKAEVCTGGIDTKALDPRSMNIKAYPNLYAIGEALDITGWLGGYNFQWAWSSAWCCAQSLIKY